MTNRLNNAQILFVGQTDAIKSNNGSDPADVTAATATVSLPTDCLKLIRLSFKDSNGYWKKLTEITKEELDLNYGNWEADTDDPVTRYINNLSSNNILLYPIPKVSRADSVKIEYVKKPTALSATTEALDAQANLVTFHQALCFYVSFLCKTDEKKNDEANNAFALWMKGIDEAKKQLASRVEDQRIVNIYEQVRKGPLRSSRFSTNPFNN